MPPRSRAGATCAARRYQATASEVDAAVALLAGWSIVRVAADGQVCRASPAESLISIQGLSCLGSRIDPMGSVLTCAGSRALHRDVPGHVARALRLPAGSGACAVQSTWALDETISALSTTYLPASLASVLGQADDAAASGGVLSLVLLSHAAAAPEASPGALSVEVQPPPRWAARLLQLGPAEPATTVSVRFDDPAGAPLALTVAVLHAARFRIELATPDVPLAARPRAAGVIATGRRPRRAGVAGRQRPRWLDAGGVSLDLYSHRAFADGCEIALAPKEYLLLRALAENAGQVLSRRRDRAAA